MDRTATLGRPTLKTLAAETGLAVATVSRALNDAPDIGEATKVRVRDAARRLGYSPNRAARRLRTGRTQVLSMLLMPDLDVMSSASRLIHALGSGLRGTGYHLIVTPAYPDENSIEQLRYLVETQSADAVILNRIEPEDARIAFLTERGFPFATHGRTEMGLDHPFYDYDNERFAELAVAALARRGCRRLLLIAPPMGQSYARHMLAGADAEAKRQGIALERLGTATIDAPAERLEAAVTERLAQGGVDGVLTASASAAIAVTASAEALGLRLGHGIEVAAKEATPFLRRFRPEIIAVRENTSRAGAFLAEAALAAVRQPDQPPMQFLEVPEPGDVSD